MIFIHSRSFRELILEIKRSSPKTGKPVTYGQIAQKLELKSPRLVSMLAKGDRLPSMKVLNSICQWLQISSKERHFLELLVQKEKLTNSKSSTCIVSREIEKIRPKDLIPKDLSASELRSFSKWYYYVIKQIAHSNKFNDDVGSIFSILRKKVSKAKISMALNDLSDLGLIKPKKTEIKTRLICTQKNDIPSASIKNHHKEMLARAIESIDEQRLKEENFKP